MHTNDHDSWKYVQLCLLMSEMNDEMIQHKNMPGWCQNENKIYKKKRESFVLLIFKSIWYVTSMNAF